VRALAAARLSEDDFIAAIVEALGQSRTTSQLRVGIGDDAAAWKAGSKHLSLITTDMLVDGIHFRSGATTAAQLARKSLAKNLSDIAAMAGAPRLAVIALGVSDGIDQSWLRQYYGGLAELADQTQCAIAGGDIVRAPALTLGITVVGEVRRTRMRVRSGARAGDVAAVTGPLGLAAAGLRVLDAHAEKKMEPADAETVRAAYLTPTPRLREGQYFGSRRACRALMDISDGVSTDIARMARASGVDAVIDRASLRLDRGLVAAMKAVGGDPLDTALNGGDDYELLAAIEPRAFTHVARAFRARFHRELQPVGRFVAGSGRVWIDAGGRRSELPAAGWDHLRARER